MLVQIHKSVGITSLNFLFIFGREGRLEPSLSLSFFFFFFWFIQCLEHRKVEQKQNWSFHVDDTIQLYTFANYQNGQVSMINC